MTAEDRVAALRSPELMSRGDTALLVVDVQERLLPAISNRLTLVWNIRRLLDAAETLGVPAFATEQYPQGLGSTVTEIAQRLGDIPAKLTFSCAGCEGLVERLAESGRRKVLVVGIEAHVCVQQTVFDLLHAGFRAYVAVDAVGSRQRLDRHVALRRMDACGTSLTTTEAVMFEWCEVAGSAEFKRISQLARETPAALR